MRKNNTSLNPAAEAAVCGIDLGSRHSEICLLDAAGAVLERGRVATTPEAMERAFCRRAPLAIAIETGGQSNWVRRLLSDLGHEVIVADAKRVKLITDTHSKDDRRAGSRTFARSLAADSRRHRRAQPRDPALRPAHRATLPHPLSLGDQADALDPGRRAADGLSLHPGTG